ncbi:MAG: oligosaccharide flippase family protein [Pseudomonadota bacterium]
MATMEPTRKGASAPGRRDDALEKRVMRGASWIVGSGLIARAIGAVNLIIVARLLAPADFGLVAVAVTVMQLLQGVSDIGVAQVVVRMRDSRRPEMDTLFTLSALRGVIIAALLVGFAPLAAAIYDDPRMGGVFLGVAATPLLFGLVNPRFYEFERAIEFSYEFALTLAVKLVAVAVSIGVALIFRSYWAIILGMAAGAAAHLGLSYALRPTLPRFTLRAFRKVFGLSGWITGVSFLSALNNKLDAPILARFVGAGGAGAYFMGLQLSEMAMGQIAQPLSRAIYPGLSSLQGEAARMRNAYLRGVEALGVFALPAAVGLALVAHDATSLLLGAQWGDAAMVIAYLAPVAGLQSIFYATAGYAVAAGAVRLVFFRELIFLSIRLPVFIAATILYGLKGAVISAAILGIFQIMLTLFLYARVSGDSVLRPVIAARRSLAAAAAMAVVLVAISPMVQPVFSDALRLCAMVGLGALVYVVVLGALWALEGRPAGVEGSIANVIAEKRASFLTP